MPNKLSFSCLHQVAMNKWQRLDGYKHTRGVTANDRAECRFCFKSKFKFKK